jgi:PAS domain S-box-containing protein
MIWNVLLLTISIFLIGSFFVAYLIEKKNQEQIGPVLEYIRDSKYKSLNKDNLKTAFDFSSLNYTSYIIDDLGKPLFGVTYSVDPEIVKICEENQATFNTYKKNDKTKYVAVKKNGNLCLVVEGNDNASVILGEFVQQIFYYLILFLIGIMYIFLYRSYRKVYYPVKNIKENNEKALVSKWNEVKPTETKITELTDLEKYSSYVIDLLKQRSSSNSNTDRFLEAKTVQTKFVSDKAVSEVSKFKLALDASENVVAILDLHGYIVYTNKALTELTGFTFQQAENKRVTDLWHKDESVEAWKNKFDALIKNKKSEKFSTFGYKKDGAKFEGEIVISPILNQGNIVENILFVERDVSEERQKERIKTEFISVVSHELRTPMTVIRGYASILADGTLGQMNPKQAEYLNKISSETTRLLDLANDMLDIQKFESGKVEMKLIKSNVVESIQKIFDSYKDPFAKKGLAFNMENTATNPYAEIDPKYYERIISNLLSNALKYTEKGEVKVFVLNPDEEHVVLAVKDTGVGIAESALPHLFERFFQAQGVMQRKQEGSGLGLNIVKRVSEAHGGMVWVESTLGVGSTFYVAIPVAK